MFPVEFPSFQLFCIYESMTGANYFMFADELASRNTAMENGPLSSITSGYVEIFRGYVHLPQGIIPILHHITIYIYHYVPIICLVKSHEIPIVDAKIPKNKQLYKSY